MNSSTGHRWCAYPDPDCTSGYRYSNDDVGDGVGGACTAGARYTLTVSVGGNGTGSIVSAPSGLACASGTCTGKFPAGTQVQLTAAPTSGSFLGWSNDCHGTDACVVTLDGDHGVGALFGIPGNALWLSGIGGTGGSLIEGTLRGNSLAMDGDGNLIIAGSFRRTIQLGMTTLTSAGGTDLFVAKISGRTGDVLWAKRFGGTRNDDSSDIAVDASNAIYIAGSYDSPSLDFGGGPLSTPGVRGGFLVKLTADGANVWSRNLGSSGASSDSASALGIAVTDNGVAATGRYNGSLNVDGNKLTSAGNGTIFASDIFAVKFTTDGSLAWIKSFGDTGYDIGYDTAIDKHGNVVVVGSFQGTINSPDGPVDAGSSEAVLVLKLASADGSVLVAKRFGSTNTSDQSVAFSVAVDSSDNIFVAGGFYGSGDFGGSAPLAATREQDAFLAKYTSVGSYIWAKSFGGTGDDEAAVSVSVNATGDVAITGSFCGAISFGGDTLTAASQCPSAGGANPGTDMFAARFSGVSGSHLASERGGGARNDVGNSVVLAPDGRIFVSGSFQGFAEFGGTTLTALSPLPSSDGFVVALPPL